MNEIIKPKFLKADNIYIKVCEINRKKKYVLNLKKI